MMWTHTFFLTFFKIAIFLSISQRTMHAIVYLGGWYLIGARLDAGPTINLNLVDSNVFFSILD